uniref:Putative secreted peptide n=1 Tax=Anopheles braziliensis TaxID=58242 RepID=A0A2M3ZSI4_9DIPT
MLLLLLLLTLLLDGSGADRCTVPTPSTASSSASSGSGPPSVVRCCAANRRLLALPSDDRLDERPSAFACPGPCPCVPFSPSVTLSSTLICTRRWKATSMSFSAVACDEIAVGRSH